MTEHPGKTFTERRVLDAIGIGKQAGMSKQTEAAMLKKGLIVSAGVKTVRDRFGEFTIPQFEMTPPTQHQWTDYWCEVAEQDRAAK